ncbi:hemoblobin-interacting domain-containing protein [Tepidibacter hydrothermalis]|uniref:DUF1533 domain-containing protein n=1 Tax=Tepidibacter hydrothermalis TaxID=3036126 RepID=A0ABY8EB32_9FIRM|nr:hemoblobin-interacting domain-containing protein [Tepidibacter hydrothermalis]WFD10161.1 DUF1533 domain-containing protein [Tepidibacter hydrothermalis]
MKNNDWKKSFGAFLIATQFLAASGVAYAAPDKIVGHRPLAVWDYHRTNFNQDGSIRFEPTITQFDTENEGVKAVDNRIPTLNCEAVEYGNNVEIKFDTSKPEYKQWQSNIYKITRKNPYLEHDPNVESALVYKIEDGKIIIYADSRAIDYNDRHPVRIYSTGYDVQDINIDIVKEGSIKIDPSLPRIANRDLLFELVDFNYRVTNPVYEVLLDGEKLEGSCEEYHVISNLIRLENKSLKKLTQGEHTLVVKAKGYKDFKKTFILEENKTGYIPPEVDHKEEVKMSDTIVTKPKMRVDTISAASGGGGSDSEGGGGSIYMPADIVFDFDMISNAEILKNIGKETNNSKKVLDIWEGTIKDGAYNEGSNRVVDFNSFTDAVSDAQVEGKHVTFDQYIQDPSNPNWRGMPYNVKHVLEDGSYGEAKPYNPVNSSKGPVVNTNTTQLGNDVVITFDPNEWSGKIQSIKVGNVELFKKDYKVVNNSITINGGRFTTGTNKITISAQGYEDKKVDVIIEKGIIGLTLDPNTNKNNQNVNILGVDSDFVTNLELVTLNGRQLYNFDSLPSNWGYKIQSDKIVLNKDLFKDTTNQNLFIKAYGYEDKRLTFNLEDGGDVVVDPSQDVIPTIVHNSGAVGDNVVLTWNNDNPRWRDNITAIRVDVPYSKDLDGSKYTIEEGRITIDKSVFRKGDTNVVIKSSGYDDYTYTQTMKQRLNDITITKSDLTNGVKFKFDSAVYDWSNNITKVVVGGNELSKDKYSIGSLSNITIDPSVLSAGDTNIQVVADGFEDLSFTTKVLDLDSLSSNSDSAPDINIKSAIEDENLVLDFVDNQEYRNRITSVVLDGISISQSSIDINKGNITLNTRLSSGNHTVKILATGYEDKTIVFDTVKEAPQVDAQNDLKVGKDVKLNVNKGFFKDFTNWENNFKVKVDNVLLTEDKYSLSNNVITIDKSVFSSSKEYNIEISAVNYSDINLKVELGESSLLNPDRLTESPKYQGQDFWMYSNEWTNNINKVIVDGKTLAKGDDYYSAEGKFIIKGDLFEDSGQKTVVFGASGYNDLTESIMVLEGKNAPYEVRVLGDKSIKAGNDVTIDYSAAPIGYKVSKILLDEKELNSSKASIGLTSAVVKGINFSSEKTYKITVKAVGYKDKEFDIVVSGSISVPDDNGEGSSTNTKPSLKNSPSASVNPVNVGENVKVSINSITMSNYEDWKDNIVLKVDGSIVDKSKYTFESGILGENLCIDKSLFTQPKIYNLVIESNGYNNISVDVGVNDIELQTPYNRFPNSVNQDENIKVTYAAWAPRVSSISINSTEITKNTDYTISGNALTINKDVFKVGDNDILVKIDGYKDLVANVNVKAKEIPELNSVDLITSSPINKGTDVKISKGYLDSGLSAWLDGENITSDTNIDETGSEFTVPGSKFNEFKTYTLIIKKDGYKDKEFSIEAQAPSSAKVSPTVEDKSVGMILSSTVDFKIDNYSEDWKDNITSVTVGGESATYKVDTSGEDKVIKINKSSFKSGSTNTCVIEATGYENIEFTLTVQF